MEHNISLEEFTLLVFKYIQKKYPNFKSSLRDDSGISVDTGVGKHTLYLNNIYDRAIKNDLKYWEEDVDDLLNHKDPGDLDKWDKIQDKIYPQIKTREYVVGSSSRIPDSKQHLLVTVLTEDLGVCFVIDTPSQFVIINKKYLSDWNKPYQDVVGVAMKNLVTFSSGKSPRTKDLGDGKRMLYWQEKDCFDAARVLLLQYESVYKNYASFLGENFLVGLSDRDLFCAFPFNTPINIKGYIEEEFKRGQHPLSPNLYIATKSGLVDFKK